MIKNLFKSLRGKRIHLVGIKGTGMAALAEILHARGAIISGSDGKEIFYTDKILKRLNIPVTEEFSKQNVPDKADLVIHSAAYTRESNPDLLAASERGIPILNYPGALGIFSEAHESCGISGVHGKTTTTALAGTILQYLDLPATVLAGSEVPGFDNSSTLFLGDKYFVAETCEYRRHFLNFKARNIIITSVELDHPDYFKNMEDLIDAFVTFGLQLAESGIIIYNNDDPGSLEVVKRIKKNRRDLHYIPYGKTAGGDYKIVSYRLPEGEIRFQLQGVAGELVLKVPGEHNIENATAAAALCLELVKKERGCVTREDIARLREALQAFSGTRRRSEIIGVVNGILFMDDYAHHPTAVYKTLEGYKHFYKGRRLVVDFMPHTYSRTGTLLDEFGKAFMSADEVILHKIYSSARERNESGITGWDLFNKVKAEHKCVQFFNEPAEALPYLEGRLRPGDLFVTMGAGNNWQIGRTLYDKLNSRR